uniref:Uncharacterized protein n=1 Tax=Fundulus heteroclitus TaxID=8078 RepID=A0A3Q2TM52_FUNHE
MPCIRCDHIVSAPSHGGHRPPAFGASLADLWGNLTLIAAFRGFTAAADSGSNGHTPPQQIDMRSVTMIGRPFIGFLCLLHIVSLILII